jgi:tRNA dimethylallyltransferase
VLGPTAAGKSDVALEIARRCGGEVVSVDSMQVYRGMDIGTAKASAEVQTEVKHHLIDVCDPADDFSVAEFQELGRGVLGDLEESGIVPVICGGSGLHFRSLVDPLRFPPSDPELREDLEALPQGQILDRLLELDPEAGEWVDLANPRRVVRALEVALVTGRTPSMRAASQEGRAVRSYLPSLDFVAIGLDPGPLLGERAEARFDGMLEAGLVDEVAELRPLLGRQASQAVGYKQLIGVVDGADDLVTGRIAAIRATRSLAKRQRTFFRRDPRIVWLPWDPDPAGRVEAAIDELNGRLPWSL